MKREELKSLIKECLVEILSEGISVNNKRNVYVSNSNQMKQHQIQGQHTKQQVTHKHSTTVKPQAQSNNLMSEIFEDTLRNTLPKMSSAEFGNYITENKAQNSSNMAAENFASRTSLEEIFGEEATEKWSKIAFEDNKSPFNK